MIDDGSGRILRDWLAYYDHATSSWKTRQDSLPLATPQGQRLPRSSVIWPRCGLILSGTLYQRPTSVRPTSVSASGFWATPKAQDSNGGSGQNVQGGPSLVDIVTTFPTPGANDYKGSSKWGQRRGQLDEVIENTARDQAQTKSWPTPRASDADQGGRGDLRMAVKGVPHPHYSRKQNRPTLLDPSSPAPSGSTGRLNPEWVAQYLMRYPKGWLDCDP